MYDRSAKSDDEGLSINDCLNPGPNLIPKVLDVLVKIRYHPVDLSTDIEKAFLKINESDREMLCFIFWKSESIQIRLAFGLRPAISMLKTFLM